MKILLLSDLHGNYKNLYKIIKDNMPIDYIFIAGDITNFGPAEEILDLYEELKYFNNIKNIYAVFGNCDYITKNKKIIAQTSIIYVGDKIATIDKNKIAIAGIDGGLKSIFGTISEFSEKDFNEKVNNITNNKNWNNTPYKIVITHTPPYKHLDKVFVKHIGSKSIAKLIGKVNLIVCGHVHEQQGKDEAKGTIIINPGPFKNGHYAILELDNNFNLKNLIFR